MSRKVKLIALLGGLAVATDAALGGGNIAVIDGGSGPPFPTTGEYWSQFLTDHGYACTLFPKEGPTGPLDPFDVVVDLSGDWTDPAGTLADFLRGGRTVITVHSAPAALGIGSNPTVKAWIGADSYVGASDRLITLATDPILGNLPAGTELFNCGASVCGAIASSGFHPSTKVLATYFYFDPSAIGIMRNEWEGGLSIYLARFLSSEIVLNAVNARPTPIPTVSQWGVLVLVLALSNAATIVIRRRSLPVLARTPMVLLAVVTADFADGAALQAQVTSIQEGGVTALRADDGPAFHETDRAVRDLRSLSIPDSQGVIALWNEVDSGGSTTPYYAISLDGVHFEQVRATSYSLELRDARFDPAIETPVVPDAFAGTPESELCIVQFVTQPLAAYRTAVRERGALLYDFLPNHAYVARMSAEARDAVAGLTFVRAVTPYLPAFRLDPAVVAELSQADPPQGTERYNIQVLEPSQKPVLADRIRAIGGVVDSADAGKRLITATLTSAQLTEVARVDQVLYVDRWAPPEQAMSDVRTVGGADYVADTAGYKGSDVRGEVVDFGFSLVHQDFGSSSECPGTRDPLIVHGDPVDENNHGASCAGIHFGNGSGLSTAKGLLPCGQGIVANWVGFASHYTHVGELVDPNLPYKAVFESVSIISLPLNYNYTTIAADLDETLFDFDMVRCQGQGNTHSAAGSAQEAWAKNGISVGAVNHFDNADSFLPDSDDQWCFADGTTHCGIPAGNCASFGPAVDGRTKPDLIGFYHCIDTTWCSQNPPADGCQPDAYTPEEAPFAGTSAATPIVCGHVGLLMEMWADDSDADGKNIFGFAVPSCNPATENCVFKRRPHASTARAMMFNTAMQYDWVNGPPWDDNDITRNRQGWGFPSVRNLYDLRNKFMIVNESCVLPEFGAFAANFKVYGGEPALKATLVYKDPPGNPGAGAARVNNLNLHLVAPSAVEYWGNHGLSAGIWSTPGGSADSKNTVENVFVQSPQAGMWEVYVTAQDVNQDGHVQTPGEPYDVDFALVISGVQPYGGCYLPGGGYDVIDRASCLAQSGVYDGDFTTCDPCPNLCN